LKKLEAEHGREKVLDALRRYCAQTDEKFASITSFIAKPGLGCNAMSAGHKPINRVQASDFTRDNAPRQPEPAVDRLDADVQQGD